MIYYNFNMDLKMEFVCFQAVRSVRLCKTAQLISFIMVNDERIFVLLSVNLMASDGFPVFAIFPCFSSHHILKFQRVGV